MIIVKLQGGLGNQMFEYAFAWSAGQKSQRPFVMDPLGFNTPSDVTKRNYRLKEVFDIDATFASQEESALFQQEKTAPGMTKIRRLLSKKVPLYIKEKGHDSPTELFQLANSNDVYYDGYWQSEKYFVDNQQAIRSLFSFEKSGREKNAAANTAFLGVAQEIAAANKNAHSVSLQIRRGDYVSISKVASTLGTQSNEYYQAALRAVAEKVGPIHVFVLSDDIEWVRQNVPIDYPVTYVTRTTIEDYQEMDMMSRCRHHVISNSSFGWWGAWLCPDPGKIVIAPKIWAKDPALNHKDLVPSTWIRM